MKQQPDENAIDFLRRVSGNLGYETESILMELPSIDAIFDFVGLWDEYDTEFLEGVQECIAQGDDPAAYNTFVKKYRLTSNIWKISND